MNLPLVEGSVVSILKNSGYSIEEDRTLIHTLQSTATHISPKSQS